MRIPNIGNKFRTGVLALAMMHSSPTVSAAEKVLSTQANKAHSTLVKSDIVTISQKLDRIADILKVPQKAPTGATWVGETRNSRIYKIVADSAAAVSEQFKGLENKLRTVKVAVPKNGKNVKFEDCQVSASFDPVFQRFPAEKQDLTARRTVLMKSGEVQFVDSTLINCTYGRVDKNYFYEYSLKEDSSDYFKKGLYEETFSPKFQSDAFGSLEESGERSWANQILYDNKKESFLDKYADVLSEESMYPPILSKGNIAKALSNKNNLPDGVKFLESNEYHNKFSLDKKALKNFHEEVDTVGFDKATLVYYKHGYSPSTNYAIKVSYKPINNGDHGVYKNIITYKKTYLSDYAPVTTIDSLVGQNGNITRYSIGYTTNDVKTGQSVQLVKNVDMPKSEKGGAISAPTYSYSDSSQNGSSRINEAEFIEKTESIKKSYSYFFEECVVPNRTKPMTLDDAFDF